MASVHPPLKNGSHSAGLPAAATEPELTTMKIRPWDAIDELWHRYRDPAAEGEPGALERLRALRDGNGWNVPFNGQIVRIDDGADTTADAAQALLLDAAP